MAYAISEWKFKVTNEDDTREVLAGIKKICENQVAGVTDEPYINNLDNIRTKTEFLLVAARCAFMDRDDTVIEKVLDCISTATLKDGYLSFSRGDNKCFDLSSGAAMLIGMLRSLEPTDNDWNVKFAILEDEIEKDTPSLTGWFMTCASMDPSKGVYLTLDVQSYNEDAPEFCHTEDTLPEIVEESLPGRLLGKYAKVGGKPLYIDAAFLKENLGKEIQVYSYATCECVGEKCHICNGARDAFTLSFKMKDDRVEKFLRMNSLKQELGA